MGRAPPLVHQIGDAAKQHLHPNRRKSRCRLVQGQDARIVGQPPGELDDPLLTDAQALQRGCAVDRPPSGRGQAGQTESGHVAGSVRPTAQIAPRTAMTPVVSVLPCRVAFNTEGPRYATI